MTDGLIKRDNQVRVLRDGEEVWKGKISSLKRFKDDVSEVRSGVECGIDLAGYKDIKVGDVIEAFTTEKMADELGRNSAEAKKERDVAALKAAKDAENEVARAEADTAKTEAEREGLGETPALFCCSDGYPPPPLPFCYICRKVFFRKRLAVKVPP